MSSPDKHDEERRVTDRRSEPSLAVESRAVGQRPQGERRVVEQRKVGPAMVDALEDILKWERASERALRIAASSPVDVSAVDLDSRAN